MPGIVSQVVGIPHNPMGTTLAWIPPEVWKQTYCMYASRYVPVIVRFGPPSLSKV